jgi:MFS family permease
LLFVVGIEPTASCLIFGIAVGPLSGAILSLPANILEARYRLIGFGIFYTCFYVMMALGPSFAGRLQDVWRSPAAALVAAVGLLAAVMPLALWFALISTPRPITRTGRSNRSFRRSRAEPPMPVRP